MKRKNVGRPRRKTGQRTGLEPQWGSARSTARRRPTSDSDFCFSTTRHHSHRGALLFFTTLCKHLCRTGPDTPHTLVSRCSGSAFRPEGRASPRPVGWKPTAPRALLLRLRGLSR